MTLFPHRTLDAPVPPAVAATPVSAGRAWLSSLLLPGAGQLYCGARTRGLATLLIFSASVAAILFEEFRWLGVRMAVMLYAFAGVDAWSTAIERNAGIDADAPDNPRVAAILNLTTNGFGYVYLGWKFGFGTFFALMLFWRRVGPILPAVGEAVAFALAAHAYIGGRNERREVYPATPPPDSSIPATLPWLVSGTILAGWAAFVVIVQVLLLRR